MIKVIRNNYWTSLFKYSRYTPKYSNWFEQLYLIKGKQKNRIPHSFNELFNALRPKRLCFFLQVINVRSKCFVSVDHILIYLIDWPNKIKYQVKKEHSANTSILLYLKCIPVIKAVFSASYLQSSVSRDHSNMLICCSRNISYHASYFCWNFISFFQYSLSGFKHTDSDCNAVLNENPWTLHRALTQSQFSVLQEDWWYIFKYQYAFGSTSFDCERWVFKPARPVDCGGLLLLKLFGFQSTTTKLKRRVHWFKGGAGYYTLNYYKYKLFFFVMCTDELCTI